MKSKENGITRAPQRPRFLVADRSSHFRETIRRVLVQHLGCASVGQAATLSEAVRLARSLRPDIALLDIDLVIGEPPTRLRRIAQAFPDLRVVVMLNGESRHYRLAVTERWGYVCIVKDQAEHELARVISALRPIAA